MLFLRIPRSLGLAVLLMTTSCFVVTDLGRFKEADEAPPSNFSDLKVTVRGMVDHVNELFEYHVVDATNTIQSRGTILPLGGPNEEFSLKGAVPKQNGPFHFDFYADHDGSGGFDTLATTQNDHSWRLQLTDSLLDANGQYVIVFDHNTSFTNLNNPTPATTFGEPVTIHMKDLQPLLGKRVEIRVRDASANRTVAMYRVPAMTALQYDAVIPGMSEAGVTYTIEIYADDGAATPASIRAFRGTAVAGPSGLETSFDGANPAETNSVQVFDALPP